MTERVKYAVVGGGPTGLGFAYASGGNTVVLEQREKVGGICRSFYKDDGVFDVGGHSFHTPHLDVYKMIIEDLGLSLEGQKREAWIFSYGKLIRYPFQKFFHELDDDKIVEECRRGLEQAGTTGDAGNFEEWIVARFGEGIARHFMLDYNRKLWARDLTRIETDWVSERVAAPKGVKEKFDLTGGVRKPLQEDTKVYYPTKGGFGVIYETLAAKLPDLRLNHRVTEINPETRTLATSQGLELSWDVLISTMPVPELAKIVSGFPDGLRTETEKLEYMSLYVVYLLAGRRLRGDIQRIYTAHPEFPTHKTALNHNSSRELREREVHGIMGEVSYSAEKPVDKDSLVNNIVDNLETFGLIDGPQDIQWGEVEDVRYAYPVYTLERSRIMSGVVNWLRERGIHTIGRFGSWKYQNSDACLKEGIDLANELLKY